MLLSGMDNAEQAGPADQEVARLRELLRNAIRLSGVTNRKIERQLGMSQGSLSRLLAGGIELKVKHILEIVEILGLPPGQFFQIAYPEEAQPTSALQAFQKALGQRMGGRSEEEAPPAKITQEQVEVMVAKALRKLLLNAEAGGE